MGERFTTWVHVAKYILGFILLFMWFDFIQCNLGEMAKQSRQNAPLMVMRYKTINQKCM